MRSLEQPAARGPAPAPLRAAAAADRQWRPRSAADRHSQRIALLKRVLPALGVALLLMVAAWPRLAPLLDSVRLGFPAIDLRAARELKMLDPRYAGIDQLNRPYLVTAAVGRQVSNRSDLMSLERPRAVMTVHGGGKAVLSAASGIYQSQTQLLDLFGDVTLTHQDGARFVTNRAHADFSNNTAEGHEPIEGHGPSGDIWGQGFRILDKGDTIIFTGRSHLLLKGARPAKAATPPPALPAAIARTATRIEAAASLPRAVEPGRRSAESLAHAAHVKPAPTHRLATGPHPANGRADKPPASRHHLAKGRTKPKPAARKVERHAG
jgi:lipopolysaccharide export system protein LptC